MGLLKFIFITIIILYVIRLLIRLVLPSFLQSTVNRMTNHQQARQKPTRPEGSISIDYMPPEAKTGNTDKLGDFVEYEDIKS